MLNFKKDFPEAKEIKLAHTLALEQAQAHPLTILDGLLRLLGKMRAEPLSPASDGRPAVAP